MPKTALVPIADGSEEIEAVTIIDVLRRAGIEVTVASINQLQIRASRGVKIVADRLLSDCVGQEFDVVALPGGMPGAENLRNSDELKRILLKQAEAGKLFGAICAAPAVVLGAYGLLKGRKATSHPDFLERLPEEVASEERVVVDANCVTSRGPGTAMEFALKIIELLLGAEAAASVAKPMVPPPHLL